METEPPVIRAVALRKEFPARQGTLAVLAGVDLFVRAGEAVAIMGPSGSGKSTLLHLLGALDRPTAGQVWIAGREIGVLAPRELAGLRATALGFIFQDHQLLPQCTALENVLLPTLARPKAQRASADRARELLVRVGLAGREDDRPATLSGGERQRVAIARALINRPRVLLCDEPTGSLDQDTGERIGECFEEIQRAEGVALVVVTHNARFARRFPRQLWLAGGHLGEREDS